MACIAADGDCDEDEPLFVDISKTIVKDLPNCARDILKALNNCKEIVKYVKLVSNTRSESSFIFLIS